MLDLLQRLFGAPSTEPRRDAPVEPLGAPSDPHVPVTHDASEAMRQQEQWLDHVQATDAAHHAIAEAAQTRHEP